MSPGAVAGRTPLPHRMTPATAAAIQHRLGVAAVALAAGLLALGWVPHNPRLERLDRRLLGFVAARTGADPGTITGAGTHDDPRTLRTAPVPPTQEALAVPHVLALTDDPEQIFEATPPSPADCAVILDNLHALGHRKLAVAATLAWETPDAAALGALDHQLGRFKPLVLGAPLARGISPVPPPPAFLRNSVPVTRLDGDPGSLPLVNQPAVPGLRLDGPTTSAGFTRLVSEAPPPAAEPRRMVPVPLLARWDDRVVFSLPLATTMARFGVGPDDLKITPGREVRLGPDGPVVPIDAFGRTMITLGAAAASAVVTPAETLILPTGETPPERLHPAVLPLVIRDDRSTLPDPDRQFSQLMADSLVALDRCPRPGPATAIRRPHTAIEVAAIAAIAAIAAWITGRGTRTRHVLFATLTAAGPAAVWLGILATHTTLPPLAILAAPAAAWLASLRRPDHDDRAAFP